MGLPREIDVDITQLTGAEQRMMAGLVPLLSAERDGVLRVHEKSAAPGLLWLRNAHRLADAEPHMRRVLSIWEATYHQSHPWVALALQKVRPNLQITEY